MNNNMNQKSLIKKALNLIENPLIGLIFYTLVIFTVFHTATYFDLFKLFHFEMGSFKNFQGDSEALVTNSIKMAIENPKGYFRFEGFMISPYLFAKGKIVPYLSQVGLQGIVFNIFSPNNVSNLENFFLWSRAITGFLFALLLSGFLVKSQFEFGLLSALMGLILICISPWMIAFSENLYWVIFLHFLPFIFTCLSYLLGVFMISLSRKIDLIYTCCSSYSS